MPINFPCPYCHSKLVIPDHKSNKMMDCPDCSSAFYVPAIAKIPQGTSRPFPIGLVVAILGLFLGCVFTGVMYYRYHHTKTPAVANTPKPTSAKYDRRSATDKQTDASIASLNESLQPSQDAYDDEILARRIKRLILFPFALAFYFTPSIIAWYRGHANLLALFCLNFFLGIILIGWILSLVWALMDTQRNKPVVHYHFHKTDETVQNGHD
ncbi:superinfection immunity protein [Telmatocola sphagniphila]|uniref:Superinfection immunity protein n=1 Tax=Telmatocola sphagniphila TaxID=1123043 RepID=A0A8E6B3W2_9BACT|nr:superinfection immunity protein [Telmatocola sphagniphila]QVL31231.1 superinfection immunity protein [Telmatocola sphagniphila]